MRNQAVLRQGSALLPIVRSSWVYSLRLPDIWVPRSPQGIRRVSMLREIAKIERVVIYVCVWDDGYITGIGVHINRCREGAYMSAYKSAVAPFPLGMDN